MSTQVLYFLKLFIWLCWVLVVAHGIQFPVQGSNLGPLHWEHRILVTGPTGKSPFAYFFFKSIFVLLFALLLSCRNSFRIQGISPLLRVWFANTFSRSVGCLSLCCWFPLLCGSSLVWCNPPPLVWLLLPLCVLFSYFSSLLAYIYHSRNISVAAVS